MKQKKMIYSIILLFVLFIILISAMFFTNFFSGFKYIITGMASSSQPTNLSISISGANPSQITYVSTIPATNPLELNPETLYINLTMYDADGVNDLNDTSISVNFTKSGAITRFNSTCAWVADNAAAKSANYTCSVVMWYWDANGQWIINVSGTDLGNKTQIYNDSTNFTYNLLKGMVISPQDLTWTGVTAGAKNQTSNNDPITINNTGNYNGAINVTAINLLGETINTEMITASNFTVSNNTDGNNIECLGTALVNATAITIINSISNPNNLSLGNGAGQEELYFCIPFVHPTLSSQTYSTLNVGSWTIAYP